MCVCRGGVLRVRGSLRALGYILGSGKALRNKAAGSRPQQGVSCQGSSIAVGPEGNLADWGQGDF